MARTSELSARLLAVVDALPIEPGMRVLEIGGAPGAAAREVAARIGPDGHVVVLDRSARGIELTRRRCSEEILAGTLSTVCVAIENFILEDVESRFDLAFACRVGALDGRHPQLRERAIDRIRAALRQDAPLFVDTGEPLRRVDLA